MNRTRIVRWLRVLLPLLALAILSTLFLFSRRPQSDPRIPYAQVDAESMAREPRLVAPDLATVTSSGAELSFQADEMIPGEGAGSGRASEVRLDWRRPDGLTARLTAPQGELANSIVALTGGVHMTTSTGWQVEAPQIQATTDGTIVAAGEGIRAQGPLGSLEAGAMRLAPATTDPAEPTAPAVLNFTDGVRLIYTPPSQ